MIGCNAWQPCTAHGVGMPMNVRMDVGFRIDITSPKYVFIGRTNICAMLLCIPHQTAQLTPDAPSLTFPLFCRVWYHLRTSRPYPGIETNVRAVLPRSLPLRNDVHVVEHMAEMLSNLGNAFLGRYEQLENAPDIEQAIKYHQLQLRDQLRILFRWLQAF
ncbi:hypothetical protein DAEQUDRAFT_437327 [Daedalea quercina L-15889]|uniref:Uncharacterized protein n=1 Tax=Daedalea quercina L-15889 TaxID=1314783 RepID=A0A165NAX9_9APHY|nr:hypothetical protein DAEQUDRAFT_437327 [Daedalea quercina L-15889]